MSDISLNNSDGKDIVNLNERPTCKPGGIMSFGKGHPLHDLHGVRHISKNSMRVPNFAGANLPRCDQGDREYYTCTMLTLFKPWRKGTDLKGMNASWDDSFNTYTFSEEDLRLMKNFNIRYECLDARDDYRAQMKKGLSPIFGSWDTEEVEEQLTDVPNVYSLDATQADDSAINPHDSGPTHYKHMREMETVNQMMTSMGWTEPLTSVVTSQSDSEAFRPQRQLQGSEWEKVVETAKHDVLRKKNEHNIALTDASTPAGPDQQGKSSTHVPHDPNFVKIVDKSYLDKDFHVRGASDLIDASVHKFSLNKEQERAFRIIANHAVSPNPERLRMCISGMGGTGKTQVIKALSHFFSSRKEAHRFIIVAPTGTAAALLGGSTYHSMFGINERMSSNKIGNVKAKLIGVEYVFFDEVSMLSARDLFRINAQLAKVFDCADIPFGGLNMVFSGDFAQLPPPVGGENVSLYSRTIGSLSTDLKSQEEAIGKALWHQVTTVVILRQNMRQRTQSPEDAKLRTSLENMRYKSCTSEDISFLRTRISANVPGRASICDPEFRNVSIITGTNRHKDEINRLGALRFAQETGQTLTDFFSDDSPRGNPSDAENTGIKRLNKITEDIQHACWSQPPSSTDKHIAGKLSLCIGLPVMIRYNYATELCMTRGQEGFVHGWQSKLGSNGQVVLDTLFIKLKDPPSIVQLDGLPENIVPIHPTTTNIQILLPNDERYYITRTQVEVLINFAMTDFASQGKTRPFNVSDLNNLSTHQAYYTALSRSATAKGTLIVQGFDGRKITGGCSGALRQEFRELELLDDITNLQYLKKLPVVVCGDTRNDIIESFRKWKGEYYIPRQVHQAIRWSKRNPFLTTEVCDLDTQLSALEKSKALKTQEKSAAKRRRSSGIKANSIPSDPTRAVNFSKKRKAMIASESGPTASDLAASLMAPHYLSPKGLAWSNNSCAFDSLFTPLFVLWCEDREGWNVKFRDMDNSAALQLVEGFSQHERGVTSLEDARDKVRRTMSREHNGPGFGRFTSIERVCEGLFATRYLIRESSYRCPNNHQERQSGLYDLIIHKGSNNFESISDWISSTSEETSTRCRTCGSQIRLEYIFKTAPPLLAFSFPNSRTHIDHNFELKVDNHKHNYRLNAVVYFREADAHFISYVITTDGQIWFYDGILYKSNPRMEYCGLLSNENLNSGSPLEFCRGGKASLAVYTRK